VQILVDQVKIDPGTLGSIDVGAWLAHPISIVLRGALRNSDSASHRHLAPQFLNLRLFHPQ
jgi:hypothetical protein